MFVVDVRPRFSVDGVLLPLPRTMGEVALQPRVSSLDFWSSVASGYPRETCLCVNGFLDRLSDVGGGDRLADEYGLYLEPIFITNSESFTVGPGYL